MRPIVTDRVARSPRDATPSVTIGRIYADYVVFVCRSVDRSVTIVSPAKTAEPIQMPSGLWTRVSWVCPRNHVLDEGPDPQMLRDNFEGMKGGPVAKYSKFIIDIDASYMSK